MRLCHRCAQRSIEPAVADDFRALTVTPRESGMRVDVCIAARFDISRSAAARAIRTGEIYSAVRPLKPSTAVRANEELRGALTGLASTAAPPPCPPVLHEDARVLAFDKPAHLLMHPVGRTFAWGLIDLARAAFPDDEPHLVHRLDRETSGVALVARDADANRMLKAAFEDRRVQKTYWAIVRGAVPWDTLDITAALGDDEASPIRLKRTVRADGQPALTRARVLWRGDTTTLIECKPITGRTHQIRVHLDSVGFPLLGDRIYGQPPEVFLSLHEERELPGRDAMLGHSRHCLHARSLRFPHPDGGELTVTARLPSDFARLLEGFTSCSFGSQI